MPKKKKHAGGRPKENRKRMVIHVLEPTHDKINARVDKSVKERSTQGRVVDLLFQKPKPNQK